MDMKIADDIILEPLGGAHHNPQEVAISIKNYILNSLNELKKLSYEDLIEKRINKYENIGEWKLVENS